MNAKNEGVGNVFSRRVNVAEVAELERAPHAGAVSVGACSCGCGCAVLLLWSQDGALLGSGILDRGETVRVCDELRKLVEGAGEAEADSDSAIGKPRC